MMPRPMPPEGIFAAEGAAVVPALDLGLWARATFVDEGGVLANEEHAPLRFAEIGFLWTSVENVKKGRRVIGMAEPGAPQGAMGKWARARAAQQIEEWFGLTPDFLITIEAAYWAEAGNAECCALIEHELYHCAQDVDAFGAPKFNSSTGRPSFTIRGHDVEEFVGVVRRYGSNAAGVSALVEAANRRPEVALAAIGRACGTCLRAA